MTREEYRRALEDTDLYTRLRAILTMPTGFAADLIGWPALAAEPTLIRIAMLARQVEFASADELPGPVTALYDLAETDEVKNDEEMGTLIVSALDRLTLNDLSVGDLGATRELPADHVTFATNYDKSALTVIIHGTWASGGWWLPNGDFHDYLTQTAGLTTVYDGPLHYEWSGAYTDSERRKASETFAEWVRPFGKQVPVDVFAHSHGANVAMLATRLSIGIRNLVMLSVPVQKQYFPIWPFIDHAYNIQASSDSVVWYEGQKWFENGIVREHELKASGHSASHSSAVWENENLWDVLPTVPKK